MYDEEENVMGGEDDFDMDEEGVEVGETIADEDFGLEEEDPDKDR